MDAGGVFDLAESIGGCNTPPFRSCSGTEPPRSPGQGQYLLARLEPGIQGGVPDNGGSDMEVAALDSGAAPLLGSSPV